MSCEHQEQIEAMEYVLEQSKETNRHLHEQNRRLRSEILELEGKVSNLEGAVSRLKDQLNQATYSRGGW